MRILYITNWFAPDIKGGAEISLYHTCRALQHAGVPCTVLSIIHRGDANVDEWYHVDHIPVHRIHFTTRWPLDDVVDLRVYQAVKRELAATRPALVHIHNVSGASLAPFLACRHAGVPVVCTLHDLWLLCPNNMRYRTDGTFCDPVHYPNGCNRCFRLYDYWAPVPHRRRLFAALTANVRAFIAPSQALIDRHVEAGYDRGRFQLVPYGINEPPQVAPRHPVVQELVTTPHEQPTIVFAGGGSRHKGAQVVLKAIPHILAQLPQARLIVAAGAKIVCLNNSAPTLRR